MLNIFSRTTVLLSLLATCSLSLAGGSTQYQAPSHTTKPSTQINSATNSSPQSLNSFTHLVVSGNVSVILNNSSANSIQFLNGTTPKQVKLSYAADTLSVSGPLMGRAAQVQLNIPGLNELSTSGNAAVSGQLNSSALTINSSGNSRINLGSEIINLQEVTASNNSQIKLFWVNSTNLVLTGTDNSRIKVAGVAQVLHASLDDQAQLNGQYLRAQHAIIQTDNHAFVGIAATGALRAFASNDSNIFYYKYPRNFSEFDLQSANILQVDWRP